MTNPEEMMMTQFNPGPWDYSVGDSMADDGEDAFIISSPDGEVAEVTSPADTAEGNALLITAAPELLAACEAALPLVYMLGVKMNGPLEIAETHTALVAAIARAKGTA